MDISENEFNEITSYVQSKYGINLKKKKNLIVGRLENYLVRNGYKSYSEYMKKIKSNPTGEESTQLVNLLTTNHTFFFT